VEYTTESLNGARLIQDDAIFNAVLVSFGSMGLIHGLLIEAVPLFRLKKQSVQFDYFDIKSILTSLDVASLGVPGVDEYPFHFDCSINPYNLERGGNGAFARFIQKIQFPLRLFTACQELVLENPMNRTFLKASGSLLQRTSTGLPRQAP
jgi:hypothetical protein